MGEKKVLCTIPGCRSARLPRSPLCNTHKSAKRRHGDPQQRGVTVAELQPYLKIICAHIRRNSKNTVWHQLDGLWRLLVDACERELEERRNRPDVAYDREAKQQLVKLRQTVKPREVVELILAMYALQEFEPRRFKSDDAFRFQLVRRVRALSDVNVGAYYQHETRKVKRVYRDLSPRTTRALAAYLAETFGRAGLYIAAHERNRIEAAGKAKAELDKALAELK
jgi:hypothetical protein